VAAIQAAVATSVAAAIQAAATSNRQPVSSAVES